MNCGLLSTKPVLSITREDVEAEAGATANPIDGVAVLAGPAKHVASRFMLLCAQAPHRDHSVVERSATSESLGDVAIPGDPKLALRRVLLTSEHAPAEQRLNAALVQAQMCGRFC
jgi:hypothetical protein